MSGLEAMQAIRARHARARLLALTTFSGDALMRNAFAAGAAGYVLKHSVSAELIDAIVAVHNGRRYVSEQVAMILAESVTAAPLTERELQVLSRMSKGDSNRAIGSVLNISEETVKAHIKSIFSKTGASDRTQAVIMALQRGLLEL
jgi:DNA-binding NarL/FixJ family response regulator